MKFMLLVVLVIFAICGLIFTTGAVIGSFFSKRKRLRRMKEALDRAQQTSDNAWSETEKVQDLVTLYLKMVARHGPDSVEAQAFRFGTSSQMIKRLHGDDTGMKAFEYSANIIDDTCRMMKGNE